MPGIHTNVGAKRARELRSRLGWAAGDAPACLLTAVERDLGVPVVVAALPGWVAGCCWRDGGRSVLWVNGTQATVRMRFTLAHELGHLRCRHDPGVPVETVQTLAGRTTDSREVQANAFAAELLAPAAGVRALVDGEPSLEDVVRIAARYGISTVSALYRLNSLALTSRYATLSAEIGEGLQDQVWERLAPPPVTDALARLDRGALPRLSPALAGSALEAVLSGAASIPAAAAAARCDARRLAAGAAVIGG